MISKWQCVNMVADINQHLVSATWPLSHARLCSAALRLAAPSCSSSVLLSSLLILRHSSPAHPHPPSLPSLPAIVAHPCLLILLLLPSHMHDTGAAMSHTDMPHPCVRRTPTVASLTDSHASQRSTLMRCTSTTQTRHPHHTCHPLPAQTTDLCLPSLLSLSFAYPPVGEPNSEPLSPPSPSQLQPDYYPHHVRCFNASVCPLPCLHPCLHSHPSCPQTPLHDPVLDPCEACPLPVCLGFTMGSPRVHETLWCLTKG